MCPIDNRGLGMTLSSNRCSIVLTKLIIDTALNTVWGRVESAGICSSMVGSE